MAKSRHDRLCTAVPWEQTDREYRDGFMREAAADLVALAAVLRPLLW